MHLLSQPPCEEGKHCDPHYTGWGGEAQRGKMTRLRSHSDDVAKQVVIPKSLVALSLPPSWGVSMFNPTIKDAHKKMEYVPWRTKKALLDVASDPKQVEEHQEKYAMV